MLQRAILNTAWPNIAQRLFALIVMVAYFLSGQLSFAADTSTIASNSSATTLKTTYTQLAKQLANNQFKRAIYLKSAESPHDLKGEIYAVINYPFDSVNIALNNPANWCDVLILHINVKYCHAATSGSNTSLLVNLGKKFDQPLADAYRVEFNYQPLKNATDYFGVALNAKDGPLGTHDYQIWIEATPIDSGHTFLHFTYAYSFGLSGRIAMKGYLATAGRDKVGFTPLNTNATTDADYIQGVRGVVERNTMRYYLAIDAYLAALKTAPAAQFDKRLQLWFTSTDQYARQLHEVELEDYMAMKHKEYARQQTTQ